MLSESPAIASRQIAVEPRDRPSAHYRALLIVLLVESLVLNFVRLPESMRFDRFAFCDQGANLTLQYLLDHGMRPTIDFGYTYGLLPALFGRVWFRAFGATPSAYQAAMVVAGLLCAWAIAQILSQLKVGVIGVALAIITLGYACQASFVNFAHAIEAVLLCFALAFHSRGFRPTALAFATAAVFAKPSMGYVYALLLIVLLARDAGFSDIRRIWSALTPAAIVFTGLATTLWLTYGAQPVLRTVLPLEGAAHYRAMNYGLMAAGRGLWDPTRRPPVSFVVDVAGFWILATIFLLLLGVQGLSSASKDRLTNRRDEVIVTCALLHLAFLVLFFGNRWSWIYYSYILTVGSAIALDVGSWHRRFGLLLCAVALISYTDLAYATYRGWQTTKPDFVTASLWASGDERDEWRQVLALTSRQKVVVLDTQGAAELLFPGFGDPTSLFLLPGLMQSDDVRRKIDQLSGAELAVVPTSIRACGGVPEAPQFKDALKSFDLAWEGNHFEVFRRRGAR